MSPIYEPELVEVSESGVVVIEAEGLEAIRVVRGTIWATDASGRDVVASRGDDVVLDGTGKIVVSDLQGPATFERFSLLQLQWAA